MIKKERIESSRGELIVKSNDLIEASYKLTLNEQRLILFMMSRIKKEDVEFKNCRISVKEFAETYDIDLKNAYRDVKNTTKSLTEKSITINSLKNGSNPKNYAHISWLASAVYSNGMLDVEFSEKLKPYLLELKNNFSKYILGEFVTFTSAYAIRLYQMFKQYLKIGYRYYTLDEFRKILDIEKKYTKYSNLKIKVIKVALTEINENTSLRVTLEEKKEGKRVIGVGFRIKSIKEEKVKPVEVLPKNEVEIIEDYKIQVLRDMLKDFGDISTNDIKALIVAADGDINKIFTQYMNVKQSKSEIRNVIGFMIEGIKRGYNLIPQKPKSNAWNYTDSNYDDMDFEDIAKKTSSY